MRVVFRLLVPFVLLLVLGCRPPEGPSAGRGDGGGGPAAGGPAGDSRDPGSLLSVGGLGKEDYAKIRGEIDCVEKHFAADEEGKKKAIAAVFKRYGTTPDWVKGVDDLRGDSPYKGRIKEGVEARMKQVCPDGKLTPEYLALISE